ncbi:HNH endonuclease [Sagittula sp. S175]|uniref:HNH endonuclease n=1 Tax=Sagittula sp. S175 TaxID=3415129 RepID=UPI003C7B6122
MARTVNLDAMIPRADLCEIDTETGSAEKISSLPLSQLTQDSFLVPSLRKPDFQRETNQWTPDQLLTFLKSYLDNELIPSLILWRSPGRVFVIDGAHRASALMAWIRDDYGDGVLSKKFYNNKISNEQIKVAETVRKKIQQEVGSYNQLHAAIMNPSLIEDDVLRIRADNAKIRSLALQWVEGTPQKAETSFFKINSQGTPLHKIEEKLLKNRKTPLAIATRSVVRSGTGHKYWSSFPGDQKEKIEELSAELHSLLFSPELEHPIKTLNLPHAGRVSPLPAYELMMAFFEANETSVKDGPLLIDDPDGKNTTKTLLNAIQTTKRITGTHPSSLGLHPAVYFYNEHGKHVDTIFLAFIKAFSNAIRNNNSTFFEKFTQRRSLIEEIFLENKPLLNQANQAIHSGHRVKRWTDALEKLVSGDLALEKFDQQQLLDTLGLKGKIIAADVKEIGENFSDGTKSAVFLNESIKGALKCPLCKGYIDMDKAGSYDHIIGKASGGKGNYENLQITHPYCNSIKN